jgi:hypothetical protein
VRLEQPSQGGSNFMHTLRSATSSGQGAKQLSAGAFVKTIVLLAGGSA